MLSSACVACHLTQLDQIRFSLLRELFVCCCHPTDLSGEFLTLALWNRVKVRRKSCKVESMRIIELWRMGSGDEPQVRGRKNSSGSLARLSQLLGKTINLLERKGTQWWPSRRYTIHTMQSQTDRVRIFKAWIDMSRLYHESEVPGRSTRPWALRSSNELRGVSVRKMGNWNE